MKLKREYRYFNFYTVFYNIGQCLATPYYPIFLKSENKCPINLNCVILKNQKIIASEKGKKVTMKTE